MNSHRNFFWSWNQIQFCILFFSKLSLNIHCHSIVIEIPQVSKISCHFRWFPYKIPKVYIKKRMIQICSSNCLFYLLSSFWRLSKAINLYRIVFDIYKGEEGFIRVLGTLLFNFWFLKIYRSRNIPHIPGYKDRSSSPLKGRCGCTNPTIILERDSHPIL